MKKLTKSEKRLCAAAVAYAHNYVDADTRPPPRSFVESFSDFVNF
jgi:hypothetical protein